jgi:TPR repeat protein
LFGVEEKYMQNYASIFVGFLLVTVPVSANQDVTKAATSRDYSSIRPLAEQGDAIAQIRLGLIYASGIGVAQNDTQAVRWFRLAADQGLADAQLILAIMYENGVGISKNDAEAVRLYKLAADQGAAKAQHYLGLRYVGGRGVVKNDLEAARLFRLVT